MRSPLNLLSLLCLLLAGGAGITHADENSGVPADPQKLVLFDPVGDAYRHLSSYVILYRDDENSIVQSIQLTGIYNGQWYSANGEAEQNDDGWQHRAFWLGPDLRLFSGVRFRARFDVNTSDRLGDGRVFESLEDVSLVWKAGRDLTLRVGKFKPRVTQEYITPRQRLVTFERSLLVNQILPEKIGGAQVSGSVGDYDISGGVFLGALTGDWDLPDFSGGLGGSLSVGRKVADNTGLRLDYFFNDGNSGNNGFADYGHLVSLNSTSKWHRIGLATDLIGGAGIDETGDVAGLILMPWYELTEKLRLVSRYQLSASNAADGIRLQRRYERTVAAQGAERGDLYHAAYLGFNYRIDGDNLKLMSGIEYSRLDGQVDVAALTWFAGLRLFF